MLKVGDRVVSGHGYGTIIVIGQYGFIGVRHGAPNIFFHSLSGGCENGRGYWYLVWEVSKARPMFKGNKHATAS